MGILKSLFGKGKPSKNDLIRSLLKYRIRHDPIAAARGFNENMVDSINILQLAGLPESTIATIVETYAKLKNHGVSDHEIFMRIENHRSSIGKGEFPNPLHLESYIEYRIELEHENASQITHEFIKDSVKKCCEFFGCEYPYVPEDDIFSGGDGSSEEEAIVINLTSTKDGVAAEYYVLQGVSGTEGVDWELDGRVLSNKNGRQYEVFHILHKNSGESSVIYFDITNFFGKL